MRILVFGKSKKRTRTTGFIVNAFRRAGHSVRWIRLGRLKRFLGRSVANAITRKQALSFRPDYVFVISKDCPAELMEELSRICTVSIYSAVYRPKPDLELVERAKRAHLMFLTNEGQISDYEEACGRPVIFVPQACDDRKHRRSDRVIPRYSSDVAFIGEADEERKTLIRKIDGICKTRVWGPGWTRFGIKSGRHNVTPRTFARICAASAIMLGLNRAKNVRLCFSNRTWITLGCGGFLLTSYVPGLEDMFENRKHLVWYRSTEECLDLVRYYMEHREERNAIAEQGYRMVHKNHTYDHFARKVLSEVEKIRTGPA